MLREGAKILYNYKSSKMNERDEWRPSTVIEAKQNLFRIKTAAGRTSSVAYEDLRILPTSALALSLKEGDMETATAPESPMSTINHDESQQPNTTSSMTAVDTPTPVPDALPPSPEVMADPAIRDVGEHSTAIATIGSVAYKSLGSEKQRTLRDVYEQICGKQVSY